MAGKQSNAAPTPFSFLSAWVQDRGMIRITAQVDAIADAGSTATRSMRFERATSQWSAYRADIRLVRLAMTYEAKTHLFAVSPGGFVLVGDGQTGWEEHVDPSNEGPKGRGPLRDVRAVDGEVFCAGMSRQVYQRLGRGNWTHVDVGVVQPLGVKAVCGFNSIDGVSRELLIAVGYYGEIWCRQGTRWTKMSSPTNVVLHWIRVLEANRAFCSGQRGVLLEWDGVVWKAIDLGDLDSDIWSIEWFQGNLYLATESGLFRLSSGYRLEPLSGLPTKQNAFSELHARDGVLVSIGPKHVWITEDGTKWDDITP
jgi:hypothetical protein